MTKGDRDKLRAELAGKNVAALLSHQPESEIYDWCEVRMARYAIDCADETMRQLGLSLDKED